MDGSKRHGAGLDSSSWYWPNIVMVFFRSCYSSYVFQTYPPGAFLPHRKPHRPTRPTKSCFDGILICNQDPLSPVVIIELDEVTLELVREEQVIDYTSTPPAAWHASSALTSYKSLEYMRVLGVWDV